MRKILFIIFSTVLISSCANNSASNFNNLEKEQKMLRKLLHTETTTEESEYAIVNKIANNMLSAEKYDEAILFLTDWVDRHPGSKYNAYWLLMVSHAYLSCNAEPFAEYYFDRILHQCDDLIVKKNSIHFTCLKNLIQISKTPKNRIAYFNEMIERFPSSVSITELYYRLALEYEKINDWDQMLRSYALFLGQPDAAVIQILGESNAYTKAHIFIDFNNSSKNWTFDSLESLELAVKRAISNYDWVTLERYRSKVNFFSMSWQQDTNDPNNQAEFSLKNYMLGQKIYFAKDLDGATTSNEAYLRTWGWNQYLTVWYLYFRKINFPVDPEIHGRWEWA
ncbi:MAG: tetratricopeptide repeat protein, partial [Treponema sp.]|nr:tetratricopeptide repeat protein [Treponema sp.]